MRIINSKFIFGVPANLFPQHKMDSSSATTNTTAFLHLNDDCLREVFGYLFVSDLAAVADVCNRLRHVARLHFLSSVSKYGQMEVSIPYRNDETEEEKINTLRSSARIFRNFATSIRSIHLKRPNCQSIPLRNNDHRIIEILCRYCGGALTTLKLHHVYSLGQVFVGTNFNFENLETLYLSAVDVQADENRLDISKMIQFIKACPKLRFIHSSGPYSGDISLIRRPQLKVDVGQYIEMVEIARRRSTHLKIACEYSISVPRILGLSETSKRTRNVKLTIHCAGGFRKRLRRHFTNSE